MKFSSAAVRRGSAIAVGDLALDRHLLEVGGHLLEDEGLVDARRRHHHDRARRREIPEGEAGALAPGSPLRYWITYSVGWALMKRKPNMAVSLGAARRPRRRSKREQGRRLDFSVSASAGALHAQRIAIRTRAHPFVAGPTICLVRAVRRSRLCRADPEPGAPRRQPAGPTLPGEAGAFDHLFGGRSEPSSVGEFADGRPSARRDWHRS